MNLAINGKIHIVLLLAGFLIIALTDGMGIKSGYTQTNLQDLQNRVTELEKRLTDAKFRQEKAYVVQMQLEEQEQKLASLAKSDKYRIEIVEIRADIKNIRTKIESIIKEKNDLEENLRLAKNLKNILINAQITTKSEIQTPTIINQTKISSRQKPKTERPVSEIESTSSKINNWQIKNVNIDDHFDHDERNKIMSIFTTTRRVNRDDILNISYQIYTDIGTILHFVVHSEGGDIADLDVILDQREPRNSNYSSNSSFPFYPTIKTLNEFKKDHFQITIKND